MDSKDNQTLGLKPNFSPVGVWAFSIGTSIGWGSFILTCNTYLLKSGVLGTVFGLLIGFAVIMVVTANLQYVIKESPGAGGVYSFGRRFIGKDLGFLMFWFITLTYLAILWANITSVPLFSRFFLGDIFQFGFHYKVFGYEVWLGETLLSIISILLVSLLCAKSSRISNAIMIAAALTFVLGFTFCAVYVLCRHESTFNFSPLYMEGASSFAQIVRIAAISPWAFIGFENASHFSEEYKFPVKKIRQILLASVIFTAVLYILVSLLSVCAYPPEYSRWIDYIRDMDNLKGIKAVPAFYAAHHYLGQAGIVILMLSLFSVIITSLIGNTLALSRVLYAAGRDGDISHKFAALNKKSIPQKAIYAVAAISVFIPFLGRTAIGWIVDVSTLGATMIYGMISYTVYRHARHVHYTPAKYTGLTGTALMICFLLLILIPGLLPFNAMESESYAFFIVWSVLGLVYFCFHAKKEKNYGQSLRVIVWIVLLVLVLFASMMWVSRTTEKNAHNVAEQILEYHETHATDDSDESVRQERIFFLEKQAKLISRTNILYTIVSLGLFILCLNIILYAYRDARKLGIRLHAAEDAALAAKKIAELKRSISSLLDNMPGINFSKDAKTGAYLACNKAFARYVHKQNPENVVGLTDKDLFDEATVAQISKDDNIALSMNEPYIFYEDLLDLDGHNRQFQTIKLKYIDYEGRECLLCMSQDMTDFVRIQHENATTKEAYEKMKASGIIYTHIAQTLARSYIDLYYVNLETGDFIEYLPDDKGNSLNVARSGDNFFDSCIADAEKFVHPDDRKKILEALNRRSLTDYFAKNEAFIMTYRLLSDDGTILSAPTEVENSIYVTMKISKLEDDERFVIIGISDADEQTKSQKQLERMQEESIAYNRLAALSGEYVCVYIIVPETGFYREFSSNEGFNAYSIPKEGSDFFATSREQIRRVIYQKDLERFQTLFTKENVMSEVEQNGSFSLTYRLVLNGVPVYVQLKAVMVDEREGRRLIVGVTNIDAYVRQEKEYAKRLAQAIKKADVDALTGIRNKHAYLAEEELLNKQISEGEHLDFAIAVLDLNNLKAVNDTLGHQAGDMFICEACKIICDIFKHSPVFRVGGDEFAVIIEGNDFESIDELLKQMDEHNEAAISSNGIIIACGVAKFENDSSVAAVYERADQKMYENKNSLKAKKQQ